MKTTTVYEFKIIYTDMDIQYRYVAADSEEKAEEKMEEYRQSMLDQGFAQFIYRLCSVELENVII